MKRRPSTLVAFFAVSSALLQPSWGGPVDLSCSTATRLDARCPSRAETGTDLAASGARMATSADGSRLYILGQSGGRDDLSFASYATKTGARLTIRRVRVPGGTHPALWSATAAPDNTVVASGTFTPTAGGFAEFLARFSSDGRLLWIRPHIDGCPSGDIGDVAIRGQSILFAGSCSEGTDGADAVLRAVDLRTGRPTWTAATERRDGVYEDYQSLAVAAGRVVAVGQMYVGGGYQGVIDVYRGGKRIWRSLTGAGTQGEVFQYATASPDGKQVAVLGLSYQNPAFPSLVAAVVDPVAMKLRWRSIIDPGPFGGLARAVRWSGRRIFLGTAVSQDPQPHLYASGGVAAALIDHMSPGVVALDERTGTRVWTFVESAPDIADGDLNDVVVNSQGVYLVGMAGAGANATYAAGALGAVTYQRQGDSDGYLRKVSLDGKPVWSSNHNMNGLRGYSYESLTAVGVVANRVFAAGVVQLPYLGGTVNTYRFNGLLLTYDNS